MNWTESGPRIDEDIVRKFEAEIGMSIPTSYRNMLIDAHNGGRPEGNWKYPIKNLPGETYSILHGIYGVNHPWSVFDLKKALGHLDHILSFAFPFGFDEGDSALVIGNENGIQRVYYIPFDMLDEANEECLFLVAESFEDFMENLSPR